MGYRRGLFPAPLITLALPSRCFHVPCPLTADSDEQVLEQVEADVVDIRQQGEGGAVEDVGYVSPDDDGEDAARAVMSSKGARDGARKVMDDMLDQY